MLRPGEPVPLVELQPAFGRGMSLPDDLAQGPVALVCLGGVSTPDTRLAVDALQDASAELDREGIRLIALTTSALDRVQEFVSRYHVLFPLVADPSCELRERLGASSASAADVLKGVVRELGRPRRQLMWGRGWIEPGAYAAAACLVLSDDGTVYWSAEGVPIAAMVDAARLSRRG